MAFRIKRAEQQIVGTPHIKIERDTLPGMKKRSPKTDRKLGTRRTRWLAVRLTEAEYSLAAKRAHKAGISLSAYLRSLLTA